MFDEPKISDKTPKVYLSRRNLLTLLSKLDRDAAGEETACTLIKMKQKNGTAYNQTMKEIMVIAVQDEDYYPAQNRSAGEVHPSDTPLSSVDTNSLMEKIKDTVRESEYAPPFHESNTSDKIDFPTLTKPEVAKVALEAAFRDRPKYFKTK